MNQRLILIATLIVLTAIALLTQRHATHSATSAVPLPAAPHSGDGQPYVAYPAGRPELSVLKIAIPPHSQLKWHTHPMPNIAYILIGASR